MIERTNAFKVGETPYLTLTEAQKAELKSIFPVFKQTDVITSDEVVDWMIVNKVKIIDILTTTINSKTKARKINGGTKVHKTMAAVSSVIKPPLKISVDNAAPSQY